MLNFTAILQNTEVASTSTKLTITNCFKNIAISELLHKLKNPAIGEKDGSHFLRCSLKVDSVGNCLPRTDYNTQSMANMLIIDCDKRIDIHGIEHEGAPDPLQVHQILRDMNIAHILYGSHSHYVGNKGNRYRIILHTNIPYKKEQLSSTLEPIFALVNCRLENELLVDSTENYTWSQPWYYPRKPANSIIENLYYEYLEGDLIEVCEPVILPPINNFKKSLPLSNGEISPIDAFNKQNQISILLTKYGYKKIYQTKDYEKWLSPNSASGNPGITVKDNKFFSHHSDEFNDGYWHDAFDLMRIHESLSEKEAIKYAASKTVTHNGITVDKHNKNLKYNDSHLPKSIRHVEILGELLKKIEPVNFRKAANILDEKDKLKAYHFHVIVIEKILNLAKKFDWGICRNHDFVYLYNGAYWSFVDADELKNFLGEAAEKMSMDKFYARYFNFRDQLYKQFLTLAHLPKPEHPKDIVFVNLKNGTFEITEKRMCLKPFNRERFITYQLPFDYNSDASAPLFLKYLDKVLPDKKLQNILSEYLGYIFIKQTTLKLEKTLLLYGKGANGKSVFYEIVRNLIGEQNTSEYSLQSLTNETGYHRAMIAHKLVNYASEINGKLEASIFKQLVSGEPVEARLPYGNPFTMSDYAKLIFNCNELPKDVEQTQAFFRRFLIVPFNVTIPENEQDKQLAKKIIETELSGVFNWVLEGLKRLLIQKKFSDSDVVREACEQYEKESNSVRLFIDEYGYKPSSSDCVAIKTLYQDYRTFCLDDGFKPVNKTNFTKRLEDCKIVTHKKNYGKVAFIQIS